MNQKLKTFITMFCICLIFFAGAIIELKTNFVPEAIVVGQDIATSMLKVMDRYMVLKENWFQKVLVYKSMLKEKLVMVNYCLITNVGSGWRVSRII